MLSKAARLAALLLASKVRTKATDDHRHLRDARGHVVRRRHRVRFRRDARGRLGRVAGSEEGVMGGHMTWPRFRDRNFLRQRPNYYTSAPGAPQEGQRVVDFAESPDRVANLRDHLMLSGEIDRMVYGTWLTPEFQDAIAEEVGIPRDAVNGVMQRMLRWDWPFRSDLAGRDP